MRIALLTALVLAGCVSAGTKAQQELERERLAAINARIAEYQNQIESKLAEVVAASAEDRNHLAIEVAQLRAAKSAALSDAELSQARMDQLDAEARQQRKDSAWGFVDFGVALAGIVLGGSALADARKKVLG